MERQIKKWFSIVFCVVLVGTMLICLLKPATYFSENENRVLAQMPQASVDSILSGEYTKEIEEYTTDQFPMRDSIVGVKAHLEQLSGKQENNGVYFAKEGYLIEKPSTTDLQTAKASMDSIKKVDALGKYNISLLLVPTAYEILRDYLPAHVYEPIQEQVAQLADETFSGTGVTVVDPAEELAAHKGDYIYFRAAPPSDGIRELFGVSGTLRAARPYALFGERLHKRGFVKRVLWYDVVKGGAL